MEHVYFREKLLRILPFYNAQFRKNFITPFYVFFFCSCGKNYYKQEVRFVLYFKVDFTWQSKPLYTGLKFTVYCYK